MSVPERLPTDWKSDAMRRRIARRYAAERRFKLAGFLAVLLSAAFLTFLLATMMGNGLRGFTRTEIALKVDFPATRLPLNPSAITDMALVNANLPVVTAEIAEKSLGKDADTLLAPTAWLSLRDAIKADPTILSRTETIRVPASTGLDLAAKSDGSPEFEASYDRLRSQGIVHTGFNWNFLGSSDGTDPVQVGIWGAFKGSLLTMLVTLLLSFPIGVATALYLEEYAPKTWWTDIIEVSINNLAAVPSIIFGLLGLSIFLNFLHLPRSAALVGGMTLALMTMPVIVIAGRNAIKSVPPSIRDAALGIGASPVQVVFQHVLPLALPGILTGTIIGMARALGETAPLLMIGMRAFIATPPGGVTDPATVLPVQIFLWSDEVSKGFVEKTSAAIIVLLLFLLAMNGLAIYLRNKFEKRW
ncbi:MULTISPECIES: phosphate ABC transporter permease PstA [unclassified Sphingobium]|uniref:phosphate ABC transporter permease PstA n=1 Tax=unclassified Sphingobium TaxID=2611147 RepID=UPI0035A591EB